MNRTLLGTGTSLALATAAGYLLFTAQLRRAASLKQLTQLATRLAAHNEQTTQANAATLHKMGWSVCREHNMASDLAVMEQSHQLRTHAQAVADTLQRLQQQFRAGHPPTAGLRRLPALLDAYTQSIQPFVPTILPLTHPARLGELLGWAGEFSLEAAPTEAAAAHLTYLENRVRHYETEALQAQASKVGERGDYFSLTQPLAIPASELVAPGSIYEARLFLTRWGRPIYCTEKFFANGAELRERGQWGISRQYTHLVPPARPGLPDTVPAQWQGTIQATGYTRDTVLAVRVPYLIIKRPAR
jgi:hypothetical protein